MQGEECKTTYKRDCYVETTAKASSVKLEVCRSNYVRDCDTLLTSTRTDQDEGENYECTQEFDTGLSPSPA